MAGEEITKKISMRRADVLYTPRDHLRHWLNWQRGQNFSPYVPLYTLDWSHSHGHSMVSARLDLRLLPPKGCHALSALCNFKKKDSPRSSSSRAAVFPLALFCMRKDCKTSLQHRRGSSDKGPTGCMPGLLGGVQGLCQSRVPRCGAMAHINAWAI